MWCRYSNLALLSCCAGGGQKSVFDSSDGGHTHGVGDEGSDENRRESGSDSASGRVSADASTVGDAAQELERTGGEEQDWADDNTQPSSAVQFAASAASSP